MASEIIKNVHTATFASMLLKSSSLLHVTARDPFSIGKHILSTFRPLLKACFHFPSKAFFIFHAENWDGNEGNQGENIHIGLELMN